MEFKKAIFTIMDEYYPLYLKWCMESEPDYLIVKRVNSNLITDLQSLIDDLIKAPSRIQNIDRITLLDTVSGSSEPLPGLLLQVGQCCKLPANSKASVVKDTYGRVWPVVDAATPRPTILHAIYGVIKYNNHHRYIQ